MPQNSGRIVRRGVYAHYYPGALVLADENNPLRISFQLDDAETWLRLATVCWVCGLLRDARVCLTAYVKYPSVGNGYGFIGRVDGKKPKKRTCFG